MKEKMKLFFTIAVIAAGALFASGLPCSSICAAENSNTPISPAKYQEMLGKGMDVDWSKTGAGRKNYSEAAVKNFKKANIQHVRIRVKDSASEELYKSLDKQINDCINNGLIPVLAYQANEFKNSVSEDSMAKAVAWWKETAEHYKDYSYLLSFDLLIECSDALNKQPEKLNEYFEKAVSEIRVSNPQRILIMSPRVRSDAAYLSDLKIPTKANGYMMAEWHFYASGPSPDNPRKLWTTGTKKEKSLINEKINLALSWQKETGIPTWVGAWMAENYNDGNDYSIKQQVNFAHYMVTQLEAAKIPFAVNSDTKFYNRETNTWVKKMLPLRYCIYSSYKKAQVMLFKEKACGTLSAKLVSKKFLQITWKKMKNADGYVVALSTSPKFNKHTKQFVLSSTKKKIKNLKLKRKYYIKVTGYINSSGKKVYSKHSKIKTIKL